MYPHQTYISTRLTITQGCWRAYLWQKLQQANIKNTDFVGTLAGQGCGFPYDGENEGHVKIPILSPHHS
jgi:hypothetical protein